MKFLVLFLLLGLSPQILAQSAPRLIVTVIDENGVPVASAQVILVQTATQTVIKGETDLGGRREFINLTPGNYRLRVEKEGFYVLILNDVRVGETETVGATINHEQEVRETINVTSSPPAIDQTKTAAGDNLNSREIINIPYSTSRDFRNILRYFPGVVQDPTGQVHVNGSASNQILSQLDGFNISHPASGLLGIRLSPDALRSIEVQGSRYSAEYGKGSGGVLSLNTAMGDDRYRFSVTDFVPSFQTRKGVNINGWTPRAVFSGPLRKGRAWFFNAIDGEYNLDIIDELPSGADRSQAWRVNNLIKTQVNLSPTNILTAGLLINYFHSDHNGLSRFSPLETTREFEQSAYVLTVKDQSYLSNGLLVELGFGVNQFNNDQRPLGSLPYVIRPEVTSGNFFRTTELSARRYQLISNVILPSMQWRGQHELKVGMELERNTYRQYQDRRSYTILRADDSLAREVSFGGAPRSSKHNTTVSGFAQDRWAISNRWYSELGLRMDWDTIVREPLISPRISTNYLLRGDGETKVSAGIGLFYDATNIGMISRSREGRRFDLFYTRDGLTPVGPRVETSFLADERQLKAPRSLNWSLGLEHKLPASIYLKVEFVEKRGSHGLTYVNWNIPVDGRFELKSDQLNRYDGVSLSLRHTFKNTYQVYGSYTRSSTRSNAVIDYAFDNPLFSPQTGGPLPWDTPNRFISWGWLPLVWGFDLLYALEWRDGFPFSLVNQDQQLVGAPNSQRFPEYFSLNVHAERRFQLLGLNLALRAGFNNVTNRENPSAVDNNVDSPNFMTFGGVQRRAFTGRIRFLGRK